MRGIGHLFELITRKVGRKKGNENPPPAPGRKRDDEGSESATGEIVKELIEAIGSEILSMGQWVIRQMKRTTGGDAPPVNGERFGQGSNLFRSVDEALQEAVPNDSWDGSGSDAYADQNTRQQVRSETVSDADGEVAKVLYREAGQIKLCRSVLDDYHNFLAEVGEYTFYLQFVPRYGEAAKMAIELATVNTALTDCTWQLHQLNSAVNQNAAALQLAVGRYAAVADGAVLTITDFGGPPPGSGSPPLPPIERSQPRPDTPPSAPSAPADGASPRNVPPPSALPAPHLPLAAALGRREADGPAPDRRTPLRRSHPICRRCRLCRKPPAWARPRAPHPAPAVPARLVR